MIKFDVDNLILPMKQKNLTYQPHPLKQFFEDRLITNLKLAEILEVSPSQICYWLTGKRTPPEKYKLDLDLVAQKISEWEKDHGYMLNSQMLTINKPDDKKAPTPKKESVCPYADKGVIYGTDFDEYDVCMECEYRKSCEEAK